MSTCSSLLRFFSQHNAQVTTSKKQNTQSGEIFVLFYPLIYFDHTNPKKHNEKLGIFTLLPTHYMESWRGKKALNILAFYYVLGKDILIMNFWGHFNMTGQKEGDLAP